MRVSPTVTGLMRPKLPVFEPATHETLVPSKQIIAIVVSFNVDIYLIGYCILYQSLFLLLLLILMQYLNWVLKIHTELV